MTGTIELPRRVLLTVIVALVAALAVSASAPADAHAYGNTGPVHSSHTGWVKTRVTPCYTVQCHGPTHDAWEWNGRSWTHLGLGGGIRVYAYPYSGEWHWVWLQATGWVAIRTSSLEARYF